MQNQGGKGYQETLLVDTLDRMRRNPEGRKVVHLHLSQLMVQNRTPVRIKIVTRMFRTLESGRQVQIFDLSSDDLAMIVSAGAQRDVNNIVHRIRKLFEGDPATLDNPDGTDRFATWYDLSLDSSTAIQHAQNLRQEAQQGMAQNVQVQVQTLTPPLLDMVQKKIAYANVVPFIRDQVALRVNPETKEASIEFYEFFLSVGDLQRAAAPELNFLADRWLFQDLSRTMDMRMLETVVRAPHARGTPCISLNLNLETILTPAFNAFLEQREQGQKIIVEVQVVDVLTNYEMYVDVRNALNSMGHAVLIDGLTTTTVEMLDVASMKPDYAKISWAAELLDLMDSPSNKSAAFVIQEIGADKVILSRCDSSSALSWGVRTGITLFQGHFLDALKSKARRPGAAGRGGA
jgi:EAL domain-containing protein (putative c-di-GMP-specific phosphodiesterase class I)